MKVVAVLDALAFVLLFLGRVDALERPAEQLRRRNQEYSFRLGLTYFDEWCLECESHRRSGSECYEGDMLVIDECGTSARQSFLYEETGEDKGRFIAAGSRNLCFTREGDEIRLRECDDDDDDQIFESSGPDDEFLLFPDDKPSYCLALDDDEPDDNNPLIAMECDWDHATSYWQARDYNWVEKESDEPDERGGSCPDVCFEITQDGGFSETVRPIATDESVVDFYDYDGGDYSFNGDDVVPLVDDYSLIFLHQNEDNCDLAFVIVHDAKEGCSGGEVEMWISGDLEDSAVQDGRDSPSDTYEYSRSEDKTLCSWEWNWQGCKKRTDGIADYWDPSERSCITVEPDFISGIDEWQFASGPRRSNGRVDPDDYITLDMDEDLRICATSC